MKKNFFEKHPRIVLLTINVIFLGIIALILTANILSEPAPQINSPYFSTNQNAEPLDENGLLGRKVAKSGDLQRGQNLSEGLNSKDSEAKQQSNLEKYSIYDRFEYRIRCQGKRNIALREHHPNLLKFNKSPYEAGKSYRFAADENGFVFPSKIYEKPDLTIVFQGGSTTECENVEEFLRFPFLAGKLIGEELGKKVNSYNAGKSGNNSIHSVNILINKVAPLRPNYVVWMENINDLSTLLYEATYWNRNKTRSNLGCFTKKTSSMRNHNNEWALSPYRSKITDPRHRELVKEEYRKIIRIFVANVRAIGAKPVLMTQFNRIEKDENFKVPNSLDPKFSNSYRNLYREFNQIIREIASEQKIPLIDLAAKIPAEEKLIYDVVHLTNSGSQMAAKIIAQEFKKIVKVR